MAQRQAAAERVSSPKGLLLFVNRSIQSEGTFGVLKQDWGFRRFLRRGSANVFTEMLLYAFAFNIKKLHYRIMQGRLGLQLFIPNTA